MKTRSNRIVKRSFDDRQSSIDDQFAEAIANIDQARRERGSRSLVDFIQTYCVGLMIDTQPSDMFIKALQEMETALSQTRPYNIELSRGSGKTSAAEMAALYLLATGRRKFCVIVSQNANSAASILKDIARPILEKDTAFSQDFPEVCLPFQLCDGAFRRRQLHNMAPTEIQKTATVLQFARLKKPDGTDFPTSGSVVTVRGVTSGIRGLKVGRLRPDMVLLDDLQTAESASSPEQVQKLLDIIEKDILNLSSSGRMTVVMTSTPLCPEDLCEAIENKVAWKTTKYPAMIRWPKDILSDPDNGLWAQYFRIYDSEDANDEGHSRSLEFYKNNKEAMDEGAILFQPNRFRLSDGHISGLQALLEKRHLIGDTAFQSEMQMKPKKLSAKLDISPRDVVKKIDPEAPRLTIPDGYGLVVASTDLNLSYALTTAIVAFKRDMTAHVLHHFTVRSSIDMKLAEAEYQSKVFEALTSLGDQIKSICPRVDCWSIDASGAPFDAVTLFCRSSAKALGLPACAMLGRASQRFNPTVRTRLRDAINRTVLCGTPEEHVKRGSGKKYQFWDSDWYRVAVQKAILAKLGAPGSCSLFSGRPEDHSDFAIQVCNEKLLDIQRGKYGKDEYVWRTKEPHDYLDAMAQAFATAASQGISGESTVAKMAIQPKKRKPLKRRIRLV